MNIIEAIILAIIEGLTEYLPVSSTGHMVIASSIMGIAEDPFTKLFTVVIQLGGILAVVVLYFKRFFQSLDFYFKLFVAFIPSAVIGLLFKSRIDAFLENPILVAVTLLLGGIFFLFVDNIFRKTEEAPEKPVRYPNAFWIGCFQVISMIPGVSRSAATIIGGLSQGLNKKQAAEFSFFLAVPTMLGATAKSLFDYFDNGISLGKEEITLLAIGNIVAFIVAVLAIKGFISFLTKHGFRIFGWYRIVIGALILLLYFAGVELSIV